MTSKGSKTILKDEFFEDNNLQTKPTNDGSLSLYSHQYNEAFHSKSGARKESEDKFIIPSQLHRFPPTHRIYLLDICFGLGYNSCCFLEELLKTKNLVNTEIWGLEIDKRPLQIGLNNLEFRSNWSPYIVDFLDSLRVYGEWNEKNNTGKILWGDARQTLKRIPSRLKFDLIFLDAFSPPKCPQLWSEEFLFEISNKLSNQGRLITYSRAASVRATLKKAGLKLKSLSLKNTTKDQWSAGTIASRQFLESQTYKNSAGCRELNQMEEEHLVTRAAIPYRDPNGNASFYEILSSRQNEQQKSNLKSTSSWRNYWAQRN